MISTNPEDIIRKEIGKYFTMKESSIGEPDIYLGGKVRKVILETGESAWTFSLSQYVQNACRNVQNYLKGLNKGLKPSEMKYFMPKKAAAPLSTNHRPELDMSDELKPELASYYQSLIGISRCMV